MRAQRSGKGAHPRVLRRARGREAAGRRQPRPLRHLFGRSRSSAQARWDPGSRRHARTPVSTCSLTDATAAALDGGLSAIRKNYEISMSRKRLTTAGGRRTPCAHSRGVRTPDFASRAGTADLIIEAVFEDLAIKQQVFRELDAMARPGCILATNTSTLDIDAIASVTSRPSAVVGPALLQPGRRHAAARDRARARDGARRAGDVARLCQTLCASSASSSATARDSSATGCCFPTCTKRSSWSRTERRPRRSIGR